MKKKHWKRRFCTLTGSVFLAFSPIAITPLSQVYGLTTNDTLKIAAFNIKWLSKNKASDRYKGGIITSILTEFDMFAIQELRDSSNETMDILIRSLSATGRNDVVK